MRSGAPAITEEIARFAIEAEPGKGPAQLAETARWALVDTIGVAIAARHEDAFLALLRATLDERRPGRSTVLATGERTSPAAAALLNGMAGHALDYDDVTDPLSGHPSVALVPALLAVAEHEGASGEELLFAYVVGFEVACAVSAGLPIRPHYAKGWHSTATVGVLAATAGVCRLLHASVDTTRHALGMAASMASGSQQNFGTMTKPLHPGLSGWSAVMAGRLAESGCTADPSQLEAPLGYFALYGTEPDLSAVHDRLGRPWALLRDGVNVKKYPCCYNTHRTADAALTLAAKLGGDMDGIEHIRVTLEPGGFQPLIRHRPLTGLEGKFSVEYVIAAALIDGHLSLGTFTDEAVLRPLAQTLIKKVDFAEAAVPPFGTPSWEQAYATLEISHHGQALQERVDVPSGHARKPLSPAELEAKFRDCVTNARAGWDADALLAELEGLPQRKRLDGFEALAEAPLPDAVGHGRSVSTVSAGEMPEGAPEEVLLSVKDHVARVTLNRPERRNALSYDVMRRLVEAFDRCDRDVEVWAVVVTGVGDRAFCAGADLKELDERARAGVPFQAPMTGAHRNVHEALLELGKPTIAALNGHALAGGFELALACDLRIAADHVTLGLPEAKRGMGANFGSVLLPRLVPRPIALEMLYTGEPITAARALEIGLVNKVVPLADLEKVVEGLVSSIVANAPLSLRRYKEMATKGWGLPVPTALRLNVGPNPYLSEDREEGVRAFVEKRPAHWRGR